MRGEVSGLARERRAWTLAELAALPQVAASYPVLRPAGELHGPYASQPRDSLFKHQWAREHRNAHHERRQRDHGARHGTFRRPKERQMDLTPKRRDDHVRGDAHRPPSVG